MAAFKSAYADFYASGMKYEFITEISPNTWRISRKSDRMEFLAQDFTNILFTDADARPLKLTACGYLLAPEGLNTLDMVKVVLNHPNLVSLVDCFALNFSKSGKLGYEQWFTVWDYCDAGNLGNLLVPSQPRPHDRVPLFTPVGEDGDVKMEDASHEPKDGRGPTFLPESFCWHVLVSLLRALAWLHDGVLDVVQREDGEWERQGEKLDWPPMLHRDITPQNIFIGYPRRREWYGPVKLGNYGRLSVSGHYPLPGENKAPTFSKALGPPPDRGFARLEDLIMFDANHGSVYPHQPNQPYTMVSEYRAVGEIIQAMMIEPTGSGHVERIRSQSVILNLQDVNYTGRLKNLVVKLMELDPWHKMDEEEQRNPTYVTSNFYREAQQGMQWFRDAGNDEADAYVTSRMAEAEDYVERATVEAQTLDSSQNVQGILEHLTE